MLRALDRRYLIEMSPIHVLASRRRRQAFILLFAALASFLPCRLASQQYTRIEFGVTSSSILASRFSSATDSGVGARFTYNINSTLGIDSETDFYFTNIHTSPSLQAGGRAMLGVLGPKAGIRRQRYGVFFKARPGVLSFGSAVASSSLFGNAATKRITHAVLDLGLVSEFYPSPRAVLRVDVGTLLTRYGDATLFSVPTTNGVFTVRSTGIVSAPWHLAVGAGYRPGNLDEDQKDAATRPVLEVGAQYTLLTLERSAATVRDESGFGFWGAWHFSRHFALDSSLNFFPRQVRFAIFSKAAGFCRSWPDCAAGYREAGLACSPNSDRVCSYIRTPRRTRLAPDQLISKM